MAKNGVLNKVRKLSNILYMQHGSSVCSYYKSKTWQWDVAQFMGIRKNHVKYAVIMLNRPVSQQINFIKNFWNNATVRMTVDGGTSQWDLFIKKLPQEDQNTIHLPNLVTGDFDSITEEVLEKYKKKGCEVIQTPDQDYTDFTKALIELNKHCLAHKIEIKHAIAIGQASGRIDHILGNLQTLYLAKQKQLLGYSTKLYMLSDDAISWLLFPGNHVIFIPEETRQYKKSWCSLVPIGESCMSVTTSGLKWNLDNAPLQFGELVSTSNAFDGSEEVKISCSNTVLWSMKVPNILCEYQ